MINNPHRKHLHGLDLLKGSLILLVIVGHVVKGQLNDTLIRYLIYGFHMPLFVGISGFLIDYDKLKAIRWVELINKYLYRIIIPWVFAVIVYFLITTIKHLQFKSFLDSFIHPFFHLWYIPGVLSYIVIAALSAKLNLPLQLLLWVSLIISIVAYYFYLYPIVLISTKNLMLMTIEGTLRPQFFIFFCTGMYFRLNRTILMSYSKVFSISAACSMLLYIYCFYYTSIILSVGIFFIMNISLMPLMFKMITNNVTSRIEWLEWIGINSLPIYLWHVIPLLIIKTIPFFNTNDLIYYFTCVVIQLGTLLAIKLLTNVKPINNLVFGAINNQDKRP